MTIDRTVSVGDLLTVITILFTALELGYGWHKDRQLRRKEYADRIRRAAGTVVAKLERWPGLALRFFDYIQPLLVKVDNLAVQTQDAGAARDELWQGLYDQRAALPQRIADEKIEIAYIDLYGYVLGIQALYVQAMGRLKAIESQIFEQTRDRAQDAVLHHLKHHHKFAPVALGNELREHCAELAAEYEFEMKQEIEPFRTEIFRLITADDEAIFGGRVPLASADRVRTVAAPSVKMS